MKTAILSAIALATVFAPVAAFAATYEYVNVNGTLSTETAPDAATALTQPTDIAANSGVLLVPGTSGLMIPATGTTVTTSTMTSPSMTASSTDMSMSSSTDMTSSSTMMMSTSTTM